MSFKPRRPDYRIKVKVPGEGGAYGDVGSGWIGESGHISIKLNPGVALRWDDGLILTAFPTKDEPNA